MNLLDVLIHGFERWPYDELPHATQDFDGKIWFYEAPPSTADEGDGVYWTSPGLRVSGSLDHNYHGRKADDHFYAVVTMKQWIEERNKRKATLLSTIQTNPYQPKPTALDKPLRSLLSHLTARDYLSSVHQDWTNNYLTAEMYAEHNEITLVEALTLIALASVVAKRDSPEIAEQ